MIATRLRRGDVVEAARSSRSGSATSRRRPRSISSSALREAAHVEDHPQEEPCRPRGPSSTGPTGRCWPRASAGSAATAATIPGRSSHLTSSRPVSTTMGLRPICSLGQICLRCERSQEPYRVLRPDLSQLRPARGHRLQLRGRGQPAAAIAPSPRELGAYNYFRDNVAGVQREWWFHRSGCGEWFLAERDTRTNEVLLTALPERRSGGGRRAVDVSPRCRTAAAASASTRGRELALQLRRQARSAASRATRSARRCSPPAGARSRAASSTTARAGCMCCAGQCPNCLVAGRRRARACAPAPSRCARA